MSSGSNTPVLQEEAGGLKLGVVSDAGRSSGDIMHRLAEMQRQIRDLQTARRLEAAAVGAGGIRIHAGGSARLQGGGSLQVEDGGDIFVEGGNVDVTDGTIRLLDADGNILVKVERTPAGGGEIATFHPNGTSHTVIGQLSVEATGEVVGQGMVVQQDNGLDLFGAAPITAGTPPIVRIADHLGAAALATDAGSRGLLNRPYLEQPMYVVSGLGTIRRTSDTHEPVWIGKLRVTHAYLQVHVRAWTSSGKTGQFSVWVNDVQLGSTVSIPDTGGVANFYDWGTLQLPGDLQPYSFNKLEIKARLIGGGADPDHVTVIPYGVTKRGTPA